MVERASGRRYSAFFSYSRADSKLAAKLHKALDSYKVPKALRGVEGSRGAVPDTLHPIFRDREDLSGGGALAERLQVALLDSDALIVLCTPNSAQSQWVNEEVKTFQQLDRAHEIFPVIGFGDPDSDDPELCCLPPALSDNLVLAADLRDIRRDDGRIVGDGFEGGKLKLIAGLLGVELDQLRRREEARRRKQLAFAGVAAIVFLVLAVLAGFFGVLADRNAREADAQRLIAEDNADRAERGEALAEQRAVAEAEARLAEERQRERAEQNQLLAEANAAEAERQADIARSNQARAEAENERAQLALAQAMTQGARLAEQQGKSDTAVRMALASGALSDGIEQEQRVLLARLASAPTMAAEYNVPPEDVVTFLAVSPDGNLVMTAGMGRTSRLYDVLDGRIVRVLGMAENEALGRDLDDTSRARTGAVRQKSQSNDSKSPQRAGTSLVIASDGPSAEDYPPGRQLQSDEIVRLETGDVLRVLENGVIRELRGPGAFRLGSAASERTERPRRPRRVGVTRGIVGGRTAAIAGGPVDADGLGVGGTKLSNNWFSSDGSLYLNTFADGTFEVRQTSDGALAVPPAEGHLAEVVSASFHPFDDRILTSSLDDTARIWERTADGYRQVGIYEVENLRSAAWTRDGSAFFTMSTTRGLQQWRSGEVVAQLPNEARNAGALAISSDDRQAIMIDEAGVLRLVDIATGELDAVLDTGNVADGSFLISSDSSFAVVGRRDGRVVIWDIATRQQLADFAAHEESVSALALSLDNLTLASATPSGQVRLWDLAPLYAPLADLVRLACSRNGSDGGRFTADERAADPLVAALADEDHCRRSG